MNGATPWGPRTSITRMARATATAWRNGRSNEKRAREAVHRETGDVLRGERRRDHEQQERVDERSRERPARHQTAQDLERPVDRLGPEEDPAQAHEVERPEASQPDVAPVGGRRPFDPGLLAVAQARLDAGQHRHLGVARHRVGEAPVEAGHAPQDLALLDRRGAQPERLAAIGVAPLPTAPHRQAHRLAATVQRRPRPRSVQSAPCHRPPSSMVSKRFT